MAFATRNTRTRTRILGRSAGVAALVAAGLVAGCGNSTGERALSGGG